MLIYLLLGVAVGTAVPVTANLDASAITVGESVPQAAGAAILTPFVSFSIELSSFPDFAGTPTSTPRRRWDKLTNHSYRKFIPPKYIFEKPAGQPWGSSRRETLPSSWRKHTVCIQSPRPHLSTFLIHIGTLPYTTRVLRHRSMAQ